MPYAVENNLSPLQCGLVVGFSLVGFSSIAVLTVYWHKLFGTKKISENNDNYVSARNTQSWLSIAVSVFSSGMGSWLLFVPPETGALTGSLGVLGYSISVFLPFAFMSVAGPVVKSALGSGSRGFTLSCFIRERYGRAVQLVVTAASVFFMFIFLCTELDSLGYVISTLSPKFPFQIAIAAAAVVTAFYTVLGGTPTTLLSDKVQGVFLLILGVIAVIVVGTSTASELHSGTLAEAAKPTIQGVHAFFVLIVSVTVNQFLDQGMWQRVFASKSARDARVGLLLGGLLSAPVVAAAGFAGIMAKAAEASGLFNSITFSAPKAFFLLLKRLSSGWLVVVLLMSVALVMSTIDSIQIGIMGLVAAEVLQQKAAPLIKLWTSASIILITAAAAFVACFEPSVVGLFLISNIVSCAIVPAICLAFWCRTTSATVLEAVVIGLLSIPVLGWCLTGSVIEGLRWVTVPRGLHDRASMITFLAVPCITLAWLVFGSLLQSYFFPEIPETQRAILENMRTKLFSNVSPEEETGPDGVLMVDRSALNDSFDKVSATTVPHEGASQETLALETPEKCSV